MEELEKKIKAEVSSKVGYITGYFMSSGSQQQIEIEVRQKYAEEYAQIKLNHQKSQTELSNDIEQMLQDLEGDKKIDTLDMATLPSDYKRLCLHVSIYAIELALVNEFDQKLVSGNFGRSESDFWTSADRLEFNLDCGDLFLTDEWTGCRD